MSGAKNAVLKMMAAALMTEEPCVLRRAPAIRDVETMAELIRHLGVEVAWQPGGDMRVCARGIGSLEAPQHLVRQMRASVLVMGPVLARMGQVRVALPGGCAIGPRPIELHLRGLRKMGAAITEERGFIEARADRLVGADIHLDYPSVGATENLMMAATLARGTTVIRNAAREPEIIDLQLFLNRMGARVSGAGTSSIRIEGVEGLNGAIHEAVPDRIEAGTVMIAAVMTGGDVTLVNAIPEHLEAVTAKLREAGATVEETTEGLRVTAGERPKPVYLRTQPYPGFPTDMQPQFMALLALAQGASIVTETVYTSRMKHADELRRMGADIVVDGQVAIIRGVRRLTGAVVEASDLRAGAALILAGLAAEGETVVDGIHHVDRGYEALDVKLRALGAEIRRIGEGVPVVSGLPVAKA